MVGEGPGIGVCGLQEPCEVGRTSRFSKDATSSLQQSFLLLCLPAQGRVIPLVHPHCLHPSSNALSTLDYHNAQHH